MTRLVMVLVAAFSFGLTGGCGPQWEDPDADSLGKALRDESNPGGGNAASPVTADDSLDCVGKGPIDDIVVRFDCQQIEVESCRDLSNVVLEFEDGSHHKFDDLSGHSGTFAGAGDHRGLVVVGAWVKSGRNHSGDGPGYGQRFDPEGDTCGPDGWLVHPSNLSGSIELWATRADGSRSVRLTENLAQQTGRTELIDPRVSPDGARIAFGAKEYGNTAGLLYTIEPDGSGLTKVGDFSGQYMGFGWYGDSRHIIFSVNHVCNDSLYRLDVQNPMARERIWNQHTPALHPSVNPVNDDDVLYSYGPCGGSPHTLYRADLAADTTDRVPESGSYAGHKAWASDGSTFVYQRDRDYDRVVIQNATTDEQRVLIVNGSATYHAPTFGNEDKVLYTMTYDRASGHRGLAWLDIETGESTPVDGVVLPRYPSLGFSWGSFAVDIDRDGDGLGNAIDPTPDG